MIFSQTVAEQLCPVAPAATSSIPRLVRTIVVTMTEGFAGHFNPSIFFFFSHEDRVYPVPKMPLNVH